MPLAVILGTLVPELLKLGIEEGPAIQAIINGLNNASQPGRADVTDGDRAAMRQVIVQLQARIDQLA